jgi:hypothetical protein
MKMFIDADNGMVKVFKGVHNLVGGAKTAQGLAYILATHKVQDCEVYFQSSMDFADEEGFDHYDDAKKIWNEAMELI